MRHIYFRDDTSADPYAVGHSEPPHGSGLVLAQLQSDGGQVRVAPTPERAIDFEVSVKIDVARMTLALKMPSVQMPAGLSREEMRRFILAHTE